MANNSEETFKLIHDMVLYLVRKFNLGTQESLLKCLEVKTLMGKRKYVHGMFQMVAGTSTGILYVYVNRVGFSFLDVMTTIAHEMVHAKQWAHGELSYGAMEVTKGSFQLVNLWNMEFLNAKAIQTHEDYRNQPWEQEAFALQDVLVQDFITNAF